jgi:hypothetical protein
MKAYQRAVALLSVLLVCASALADDHDKQRSEDRRRSEPNWIIERQLTYEVQGVPTSRRIIGKREFDVYRTGEVFEKGNRVR